MPASRNQSHYINTMVFCVVAGIISLMLLLLIMNASETVQQFSPFVITVEVGLLLIIIWAIYQIIVYEQRTLRAAKNGYNSRLYVNTCPDYWTQVGMKCTNSFVPHNNSKTTFTIGEETISSSSGNKAMISLSDYDNMSISKACEKARKEVASSWTDVDAVCNSFQI